MAILKIEQYKMKNGMDILKVYTTPQKAFLSGGYFYADAQVIDLIQQFTWYLSKEQNGIYVRARKQIGIYTNTLASFHRELFYYYNNYYCSEGLDHLNLCEIDNTDANLNIVSKQQNRYNTFYRGYYYQKKGGLFVPKIKYCDKSYFPCGCKTRLEDEACIQQNYVEQVWLRQKMQNDYYMFDFKKYRRGSEDILDLERTGIISEDEATYQHILKYAENAWYYLRFGLQDYFKDNHIPIPKYDLDENGFMVHHITGEKLCPF